MDYEKLNQMQLHDIIEIENTFEFNLYVTKVSGGWIYTYIEELGAGMSSNFVAKDNI